jgi:molybdate transport system substrate-binding protein
MLSRVLKVVLLSSFLISGLYAKKCELLFYVGITMVKPMSLLAEEFEKSSECKIKILQGGSKDLYDSLKMSKKGDLYMPGSVSYRERFLHEGLLDEAVFVGYNKAALVVKKGNPKKIPASLDALSDSNYMVVLGNEQSGSIGAETKKILEKYGNYQEAMLNTIYLTTDSRNLTKAIKDGEADVVLNWYATTFWDENKNAVEGIPLDERYAKKKMLTLNLLKSSTNKDETKKFMEFATSKRGREVFYEYGFLDEKDLKNYDGIKVK